MAIGSVGPSAAIGRRRRMTTPFTAVREKVHASYAEIVAAGPIDSDVCRQIRFVNYARRFFYFCSFPLVAFVWASIYCDESTSETETDDETKNGFVPDPAKPRTKHK